MHHAYYLAKLVQGIPCFSFRVVFADDILDPLAVFGDKWALGAVGLAKHIQRR